MTYAFQSEFILYSCGFTLKRVHHMIRTYSQTHPTYKYSQLNHLASLAKYLSVCLQTKWLWIQVLLESLKLQISRLFQGRSSRASRIRNVGTSFFRAPNNLFAYTIVHLTFCFCQLCLKAMNMLNLS